MPVMKHLIQLPALRLVSDRLVPYIVHYFSCTSLCPNRIISPSGSSHGLIIDSSFFSCPHVISSFFFLCIAASPLKGSRTFEAALLFFTWECSPLRKSSLCGFPFFLIILLTNSNRKAHFLFTNFLLSFLKVRTCKGHWTLCARSCIILHEVVSYVNL